MTNKYYIVKHFSRGCFFLTYIRIHPLTHSTHGGFCSEDTKGILSIFYKDQGNIDVPVPHHITASKKLWNFLQISTYKLPRPRLDKKKKQKKHN